MFKIFWRSKPLLLILGLGFLLRLVLVPYLTYHLDVYTYIYWSESLLAAGLSRFFVDNWVDYLPGYPYILLFLAFVKSALHITVQTHLYYLYKLPAILADLATGIIIYKLTKSRLATALYIFNPAVFANSSLWGQTDSFTALFALLSLYLATLKRPLWSGLSLGFGALIKLNTLLIAPIVLLVFLRSSLRHTITYLLAAITLFMFGFLPFLNQPNLIDFIRDRVSITTNQYPHTSLNAFNFWYLLDGSWESDQTPLFGVAKHTWGNLIFIVIVLASLFLIPHSAAAAAVVFTAAFLFLTRMHERHFLPALPFLLLAANHYRRLWGAYIYFSVSYVANLIFGYQQAPGNPTLIPAVNQLSQLFSGLNLVAFGAMITSLLPNAPLAPPKLRLAERRGVPLILIIILCLSFVVRIVRLNIPADYQFDEVYHAFTAREMLKNNAKAWEWWNQAPADNVAYEWTHPPLSKHFMVLGMLLFGDNHFGWRFPAAVFGVANIFLVYLLARELLGDKTALLAAGLYSLENLSFVQSRIGMNDTYMVFFMLLSIYALLRRKTTASALSFALAISTKWSAIYTLPVLAAVYLLREKFSIKRSLYLGICFLFLSASVYLLTYLPFFTSGHSWQKFIELQQQMYWYHTRLDATHDYTSPWWSWPLMLRPVWYYVSYQDNNIANTYALGNPIIFWFGLLAVIYTAVALVKNLVQKSLVKNHWSLVIGLLGYSAFLTPWALSPRIMFLYHYLPSIPFMVILLAFWLSRLPRVLTIIYLLLTINSFLFFYPLVSAVPIPKDFLPYFFWLKSWK